MSRSHNRLPAGVIGVALSWHAVGKFSSDQPGYADMLAVGRRFTERIWAVEGCNGVGRHIVHRLVHDGEVILDVPAKLPAQVRVFATGNERKTDPVDAHSVAMVALRTPNLVRVQAAPELVVMSMLVDRRDELGRARPQTVNRLHRLLLELFPGGAKKFLSAPQTRALIATIKPRDIVGKTRRRLTVELIAELEIIDKKMKAADKDLRELVIARTYFDSKKAAGKTSMEAMRALKPRLSNVVHAHMLADQKRREAAGPGGHSGTTLQTSATGLTPDTGPSDKPQPEPATNQPTPATTTP